MRTLTQIYSLEATTTESVVRSRRYYQLYEQIDEILRLQRVQLCALHLQLFKPFEKTIVIPNQTKDVK